MRDRYLEVTYRKGRPLGAYLYLPRPVGVRSARTVTAGEGLLLDYAADGEAIGLEITVPGKVRLDEINAVLETLGQPRMVAEELAPLRAA